MPSFMSVPISSPLLRIMFKKALAHQSNATPIRSSARRQLIAAVLAQYPSCLEPGVADDGPSEKELGKVLVPEGVRMGSFETSAGIEGVSFRLRAACEGDVADTPDHVL
jgi:hypothetical protein